MKTQFNWTDSTIDSLKIIERHANLKGDYDELLEALKEANFTRNSCKRDPDSLTHDIESAEEIFDNAQEELDQFNQSFEKDEMDTLAEIIKQGEASPDWSYGEALINSDYFVEYTKELIDDCYELPSELTSVKWPYCHIKVDYEAAADQLKADYFSVDIEDQTFYIRA